MERMSPVEKPVSNGFLLEKGIWKFPDHIYGIFFHCQQTGRHTYVGKRPGSLACAILFFAKRHMLLTRAEGLPLNGVIPAGIIFAVRIQEDVLVYPPTEAEHVGGRVVTALQNLEHDLQSLLTITCAVSSERFM